MVCNSYKVFMTRRRNREIRDLQAGFGYRLPVQMGLVVNKINYELGVIPQSGTN